MKSPLCFEHAGTKKEKHETVKFNNNDGRPVSEYVQLKIKSYFSQQQQSPIKKRVLS